MAGEPILTSGQSSEWVSYLQQWLSYHGYWDAASDGEFGDELEAAVRSFQSACGLTPDGVVGEPTWNWLVGEQAGSKASTPTAAADDGIQEVPASFSVDGAPAFRFELPGIVVAEATVSTAAATFIARLSLAGEVSVSFPNPSPISLTNEGWRVEATQALEGVTSGVQIDGIGSAEPSIVSSWGNQYVSYECEFEPPSTIKHNGSAKIGYTVDTAAGAASVEGEPGFELAITVIPHSVVPQEQEITDRETFFERHREELATVGAVVLVGIAVALALETGGASLLLIPAAAL